MNRSQFRSRDPTVPQHGTRNPDQNTNKVNYRRNQVMKKLLTILTVVLALCLLCGTAMADKVYTYDNAAALVGQTVDGIVVASTNLADVQLEIGDNSKTNHLVYHQVRLYAADGKTFTTITVLFNDHVEKSTKVVAPTCAAKGYTIHYCKFCDYTWNDTETPKITTHAWVKQTTKEATCAETGTAVDYCPTCKVVIPDTEYTLDRKTDEHVWVWKLVKAPTCKAIGKYEWACKNCGINYHEWKGEEKKLFDLSIALYNASPVLNPPAGFDGHEWSDWIDEKPATCLKGATQIKYCDICNETKERVVSAPLDPVWAVSNTEALNDCTLTNPADIKWTCTLCNGANPAHKDQPSYSINGVGRVLSPDQQVAVKLKHAYVFVDKAPYAVMDPLDPTKVKITKATCEEGAYKEYICQNDNTHENYKMYVSDPAGHKFTAWQVVALPTETTKGIWNRTCTVCGKTETHIDFLPPASACTAHTPVVDEENSIEATCTDAGVTAYKCSVCGIALEGKETAALGHDWDVTVKTPATCKEEGKANRICKRCGEAEIDVKLDKVAHTWDEGKITKEATKEADGEKTFTCTVCGETKTEAVKWEPAKDPKYTMTASYNGTAVTGKLVHDDSTVEAAAKFVRVTFYVEGNYYMATMAEVEADGTFSVDGVGPIVYITAVATGNSSVNPEDVKVIAPAVEIFVK